jgi:hypothetical protein
MRYVIAGILIVVTLLFTFYVQSVAEGPFSATPYNELKPLLLKLQEARANMKAKEPGDNEAILHNSTLKFLEKDIEGLKQEINLRQINLLLGLITALFLLFLFLFSFFRFLRFGRTDKVKGFYHRGNILVEPPKTEYISEDDLGLYLKKGYEKKKDAELWLRTDEFLRCWKCKGMVEDENIGSVQEVILMEEAPKGVPRDQLTNMGSIWVCKPKDRFKCQKCGKELVRSAR